MKYYIHFMLKLNTVALRSFENIRPNTAATKFLGCRFSSTQNILNCLVELTGCTNKQAEIVLTSKNMKSTDEQRIRKSYSVLLEGGIQRRDIQHHLEVLLIHPSTLLNHWMMLQENGLRKKKINSKNLLGFYSLYKTTVISLKTKHYINVDTDIIKHASKMIGLPSQFLPEPIEAQTLHDFHLIMIHALMRWKFGSLWSEHEKLGKRLQFKSLRLLSRTFDLLTNEFELSKQQVKISSEMLATLPERLEEILLVAPILVGNRVQDIAKVWPKVVMNSGEALKKISDHLEDFGISSEGAISVPSIFSLHPENIYNRLQVIKSDEYKLNQWDYHPKYLLLLHHQKKVLKRVCTLRKLNMKCWSFYMLQYTDVAFKKHIELLDKTCHSDTCLFLSLALGYSAKDIRKRLQRNSYYLYIPHADIREVLMYLLNKGFSKEDIFNNILLLLYPKEEIEAELKILDSKPGLDCCKDPVTGKLRRETILSLILYGLEQPYNFSKELIWIYKNKQSEANSQNESDILMDSVS